MKKLYGDDLCWVNYFGGVTSFLPEQIVEFEREYKTTLKMFPNEYWQMFNYHFEQELDGKTAEGFSVLWNEHRHGMQKLAELERKYRIHVTR